MDAVILAAGRGSRMGSKTTFLPKSLSKINDKTLIEYQIEALRTAGINNIAIVTGYKNQYLESYGDVRIYNHEWKKTNMVYSLYCAHEWLQNSHQFIISYSDIIYDYNIIKLLLKASIHQDIVVPYNTNWENLWRMRFQNPLDDAETFRVSENGFLLDIGSRATNIKDIQGQYMGLIKLSIKAWNKIKIFFENINEEQRKKN